MLLKCFVIQYHYICIYKRQVQYMICHGYVSVIGVLTFLLYQQVIFEVSTGI